MFGHYKRQRERRRNEREKASLQQEINRLKSTDTKDEFASYQQQVNQLANEQKQKDKLAQQEGKLYADEVLARQYEGLSRKDRETLQQSANAQINRDIQGYERKLLAQQGRRGIRGGSAYAQQQDLARTGLEAQQQMQRDLSVLDRDLAMKKAAAAYNIEQGEIGNEALRVQMSKDILNSYNNRKYQKWLTEEANKLFQRV